MRVALYVRVSTEEQAKYGISPETQIDTLTNWANGQSATIVDYYIDAGISARKAARHRKALQRLLEDVRAGKVDVVAFTKLDRWFRNVAEYYKVQEVLDANNVTWKTTEEDYDTSTASGRLKVNIMLSVAQDEADRTGERIKAIHATKVKKGEVISGKLPLGYKIENKKPVIDEETAPIAQDIFREYIACRSIGALRRYIMDKYGIVYCHTNIRLLLSNQRYTGQCFDQDAFFPQLIDNETFERAGDILKIRGERTVAQTKRTYLFTGLVFCAECGNRLGAHVVHQKYIYYRCTRHEKLGLCTHGKRTNEVTLERWVLENIIPAILDYNAIAEKARSEYVPPDTGRIKRKMEKLKDLYLNDLLDRKTYERDYKALRKELESVELPAPRAMKPIDLAAIEGALETYHLLSRAEQKELWSRTIERIIVTNDNQFSIILSSP